MPLYHVRFGEPESTDTTLPFEPGLTIEENLERIIPLAKERGILPADYPINSVQVLNEGRVLNPGLSLEEQIQDSDTVDIERIVTAVQLRMRYKPDKLDEQSLALTVNPYEPLEPQVRSRVQDIQEIHRFRGLKRKHYRFFYAARRIDRRRTLASQGIKSAVELRYKPYTIFGVPFGILEYFLAFLALGILGITIWGKIRLPGTLDVVFATDVDCSINVESGKAVPDTLDLKAGQEMTATLRRGEYDLRIRPERYPMFRDDLSVEGREQPLHKFIRVRSHWMNAEEFTLRIQGYIEPVRNRLEDVSVSTDRLGKVLLLNGRRCSTGDTTLTLPKGPYEIRYDVSSALFSYAAIDTSTTSRWRTFLWDFSTYVGSSATLNLYYRREFRK